MDARIRIKSLGMTPTELARRAGRTPSTILRALSGEQRCSFEVALDVERATDGRLSAEEFLQMCLRAYRARRQQRAGAGGRDGDGVVAAGERG